MAIGICKLTGTKNEFVNSHLLPKSLTKPIVAGAPLIQAGYGRKPVRRWSSWSDKELVTREGEDILSDLDDWAIKELRAAKLLWSGWGPMTELGTLHHPVDDAGRGFRRVTISDPLRLQRFCWSILWRAAATTRYEFAEVDLAIEDLERLRQAVISKYPIEAIDFYPAQLTQLSSLGPSHNFPPLAQVKTIPKYKEMPERQIPIFRFYFDGLIIHFHRHASDDGYSANMTNMMVGADAVLTVTTVPAEISWQYANLQQVMAEAYRDWPEVLTKL